MGERKVLNKYFPPDFDPSKIPRTKKADINPNFVVRMMLPMTVRCNTCGEYMYKGKKFNSRKENVDGPDGEYLGIQIFRFYFKCSACSAEFTIKTDPQNMDYAVEHGARRNFEAYREEEQQREAIKKAREDSEKDDKMAALENKTKDSKMEMEILDGLDEIRTLNNRNARVEIDAVIASHRQVTASAAAAAGRSTLDEEEEDEAAVQGAFAAQRVKRLRDDEGGGGGGGGAGSSFGGSLGGGGGGGGASSALGSGKAPMGGGVVGGGEAAAAAKRSKAPACPCARKPACPCASSASSAPGKAVAAPAASAPPPSAPPAGGGGGGALLGLGDYDSSGSGSGSPSGGE